jgi:hypothetical protein
LTIDEGLRGPDRLSGQSDRVAKPGVETSNMISAQNNCGEDCMVCNELGTQFKSATSSLIATEGPEGNATTIMGRNPK